MVKKKLVLYVALAALWGACGNDNESQPTAAPDGRTALTVKGEIGTKGASVSRAIDTDWGSNDKIGIFMVYSGNGVGLTLENICDGADNKCYITPNGNGKFEPSVTPEEPGEVNTNRIYFPIIGTVDFYAYYPFVTPLTDYTCSLNIADQSNQEAIDFMYADKAEGYTKNNPVVSFNFSHQLSKLVLTITPGDGLTAADLENLSVTVGGQHTTATFNLSDGTLTAGAETKDITLLTTKSGALCEAILLPDATTSRTLTFDLNNDNDLPFTWEMDKALAAGSKYTYDVKLHRTKIEITGATITEWTPVNGGGVDAH